MFTNARNFELKDVVFQDPIPEGLTYIPATSKASRPDVVVDFSMDGGKTWAERPMVNVVSADGRKVTKPAPAKMYTNIRWKVTGTVAAGATVQASFRNRVNAPPLPTKAAPKAPASLKPPVRKST